jgi:hypothetical protein
MAGATTHRPLLCAMAIHATGIGGLLVESNASTASSPNFPDSASLHQKNRRPHDSAAEPVPATKGQSMAPLILLTPLRRGPPWQVNSCPGDLLSREIVLTNLGRRVGATVVPLDHEHPLRVRCARSYQEGRARVGLSSVGARDQVGIAR